MYPEVFEAKKLFEKNEFHNKFFDCVVANYFDLNNPIRFNNFSYAIRELLREKLDFEAPEEKIIRCKWYDPMLNGEPKEHPIRSDRLRYYFLGGIDNLNPTITNEVSQLQKKYKQTIDTLSKYTHITIDSFGIDFYEGDTKFRDVMKLIIDLMKEIERVKKVINEVIIDDVESKINSYLFNSIPEDLDLLSTHTIFEDIDSTELNITEIDDKNIYIDGITNVNVMLQYGSESERRRDEGFECPSTYPMSFKVTVCIDNFELKDYSFGSVDTSSFYEDESSYE